MGALFGGLMEYNSMYFGFAFLYLLAMGFYVARLGILVRAGRCCAAADRGGEPAIAVGEPRRKKPRSQDRGFFLCGATRAYFFLPSLSNCEM